MFHGCSCDLSKTMMLVYLFAIILTHSYKHRSHIKQQRRRGNWKFAHRCDWRNFSDSKRTKGIINGSSLYFTVTLYWLALCHLNYSHDQSSSTISQQIEKLHYSHKICSLSTLASNESGSSNGELFYPDVHYTVMAKSLSESFFTFKLCKRGFPRFAVQKSLPLQNTTLNNQTSYEYFFTIWSWRSSDSFCTRLCMTSSDYIFSLSVSRPQQL